jgi:hypothetical protein
MRPVAMMLRPHHNLGEPWNYYKRFLDPKQWATIPALTTLAAGYPLWDTSIAPKPCFTELVMFSKRVLILNISSKWHA